MIRILTLLALAAIKILSVSRSLIDRILIIYVFSIVVVLLLVIVIILS